jgi:hypothetical protein
MLGASGIHADAAWTHTIGRPDVIIAVVDSGIDWSEPDLANQAYLNPGELAGAHMPLGKNGVACGGMGPLAGYDCNGDGVFSVADYVDDPRIAPAASFAECPGGVTIAGDVNRNCILDAGDLIELFSDGIDDDTNGYADDISGWDFYKNDNDPYDDTHSGHGTSQAEDSSAQADNALGTAGVCPNCRFVMLRAGDSRIVEANDFAKAVVYAADRGASVVQAAIEAVDQTAYARAAIDYAYARGGTRPGGMPGATQPGAVVVTSMGEQGSRQHTVPATANHTLTVYALAEDGSVTPSGTSVTTTASSFLGFSACSNFGGQNMVGVGAAGCSAEAAGAAAGAAGLLFAEGLGRGLNLRAEEVMQLLRGTADVVDVPESGSPNPMIASRLYESLPYFSQRFGYGRLDLAQALLAIDRGLVPPEVDIVSPAWFSVLYASHTTAPMPVLGRVAAARAQSYDYRVEWAAGVEPDESAFQPLVDWVRNIPSAMTMGGGATPLGMLPPPAQLTTSHTSDPDSPSHENDRTITLRVLAVAHYPGGDVGGQARRTLAIVNDQNGPDPDLVPGFPLALGASLEASPKLADINGDGVRDIVAATSDGKLHVLSLASGMPRELPGFPALAAPVDGLDPHSPDPTAPSYLTAAAYSRGQAAYVDPSSAREAFVAAPAVGDVNGDGKLDIVVSSWPGTLYVFGSDGRLLSGWPKRLPDVPSCPLDPTKPPLASCSDAAHALSRGAGASPVLADFNGDGKLEIVQVAFDGNVYVYEDDATPLAGFPDDPSVLGDPPVALHAPQAGRHERIVSTPAVADFTGDGVPDILCGSNESVGGAAGPVFLVDGRGKLAPSAVVAGWPVVTPSSTLMPVLATGMSSAPVVAGFTKATAAQALIQGNGALPVVVLPPDAGVPRPTFDPGNVFGAQSAAVAPDTMAALFAQPAVGDLDQDGVPDVVVAGGSQALANLLGGEMSTTRSSGPSQYLLAMWSGATGHMMPGSPVPLEDYAFTMNAAVADITGDGYPEVLVGTGGYFVRAVDACGCEATNWPKFTGGWIEATPAVGDIDGDPGHTLEVVTGTREGSLYAWHTHGSESGVIQWESFHHDNANTGDYRRPLGQGMLLGAKAPLACPSVCQAARPATQPMTVGRGGCGCWVGGGGDGAGSVAAAVTAALASVAAAAAAARRGHRKRKAAERCLPG